jgi:hypothetical protein
MKVNSESIIYYYKQKSTGPVIIMAIKLENLAKNSWWINELDSLGVSINARNELNDKQETSNLVENIKHAYFKAYKDAYSDESLTKLFRRYESNC